MSVHELLRRLEDRGVELTLAGESIRYKSRGQELAPEILTELKQYRDELLSVLTRRAQLAWPPPRPDADGSHRIGPLTRAQKSVWATNHFLADGTYNLAGAIRLRGPLDVAAFATALDDMNRRHPSLRTLFPTERGEPQQRILSGTIGALGHTDIDAASGEEALQECLRDCARMASEQLALDSSPPARMHLFRLGDADHVFFVVLHHVVADGPSFPVLIADLAQCYNARAGDLELPDAASDIDMVDVALWEQEHLHFGDLGADRRYWAERLSGANIGATPTPTGLQRPRRRG